MTAALRVVAFLIAIAAVIDPVFAIRRTAPVAVDFSLPPAGESGHAEADQVRNALAAALAGTARVGGGEVPTALIAVGDARLPDAGDATVFAVPLSQDARVTAVTASAAEVLWGQQATVSTSFRGHRVAGKKTTFRLIEGGATLATIEHQWSRDDEVFSPPFAYSPAGPGLVVLRITAEIAGTLAASVDVPVQTRDRRARVLVFEARPSWAAGFARQVLEADPLFDVRAVARTSRGVATQTAGAPLSLASVDPESTDVMLAGGIDALSDADLRALASFAEERGGSVVLVPDGRLPEKVRRVFDLAMHSETLLERPMELRQGSLSLRASELLRPVESAGPAASAFTVWPRGKGQVVLSMGLDAWRYRADPQSAFARVWRAVVADAAAAAVPAVSLQLDSTVVRPGDRVRFAVAVRSLSGGPGGLTLPKGHASLVGADGAQTAVRLWPGLRATEYVGVFSAPSEGRYALHVALEGFPRQDAMLIVDPAAARAGEDRSRELEFLARATGGRVVPSDEVSTLAPAIRGLRTGEETRDVRPTRSPWWMVAFVACLGSEWFVRRSRGQR